MNHCIYYNVGYIPFKQTQHPFKKAPHLPQLERRDKILFADRLTSNKLFTGDVNSRGANVVSSRLSNITRNTSHSSLSGNKLKRLITALYIHDITAFQACSLIVYHLRYESMVFSKNEEQNVHECDDETILVSFYATRKDVSENISRTLSLQCTSN